MSLVPLGGNPFFRMADHLASSNRRTSEFNNQVRAHVGVMREQAHLHEGSAQADHGRHMELLGALQNHELTSMHLQHTHEATMAAVNAKADVSRISAGGRQAVKLAETNWGGANEMARTVGSFAPAQAREAFNPMDPPAQPEAPTIASPASETPAAEKPKRTRKPKAANPEGTLF